MVRSSSGHSQVLLVVAHVHKEPMYLTLDDTVQGSFDLEEWVEVGVQFTW